MFYTELFKFASNNSFGTFLVVCFLILSIRIIIVKFIERNKPVVNCDCACCFDDDDEEDDEDTE